jgi:hypothetical protein
VVKENCANIIQVTIQSEKTSASLIRPDFDFVVVPTRNEEGLCLVEIDSSNWAIVLLETIN